MDYLLRGAFGLLSNWETVLRTFAIVVIVVGVGCFVTHNPGGFRSLRIPGALLCCLGGFLLFLMRWVDSLENRAAGVLKLPKEAQVLQVKERDWSSEGTVTFKLPANHSPAFWLKTVWQLNGFDHIGSSGDKVSFHCNQEGVSYFDSERTIRLDYDTVSQTYSYSSDW